jgi:YVTN family beta-propeller protein
VLETKIPLGDVRGRIDHLAIDSKRRRLFVAELGNNSVSVVDLAADKVLRRITGLNEPQGVAYVTFPDSVYVANAGDGSVRILDGDDLAPIGRIDLGDNADHVRTRSATRCSGKGALAVIERRSHRLTGSRETRTLSLTGCTTTAFSGGLRDPGD